MTQTLILLIGGGVIGLLLGIAAMLLLRERPGAGRIWNTDANSFAVSQEELDRTARQSSKDTANQGAISHDDRRSTARGHHPEETTGRSGAPVAMLTATDGVDDGRSWLLRYAASTTIGRFDDCDIAVDDNDVSRLHAQITHRIDAATAHEFAIFDYSSTNGTMVNGLPINAVASLQDGDKIKIGNTQFLFRRVRNE